LHEESEQESGRIRRRSRLSFCDSKASAHMALSAQESVGAVTSRSNPMK